MATGTYAPYPAFTMFNDSGAIVAGGKLYTYLAGTTTDVATYTDVGLTTPNANPVIMDAAGRCTLFLTPGVSYKFVAKTAADVTLWTRDNIATTPPFSQDVDITATAGETIATGEVVYCSTGAGTDAARTAGRFYLADQTFANRSSNARIVGFATGNATAGASFTVRLAGKVTGLSALAAGSPYQISTTPGAITTTSLDSSRTVGFADSATTLLMFPSQCPPATAARRTDGTNGFGILSSGIDVGFPITYLPGTVAAAAESATVSGVIEANVTPVVQASASELNLMTYSIVANTLSADGKMLRATMYGVNSGGGAGNRTFRVYYGTASITLAVVAADGTEWRIEFEVVRLTAATELAQVKLYSGTALADFDSDATFAIDTTAPQTLKLTVQGAGATDGATQTYMCVEVVG